MNYAEFIQAASKVIRTSRVEVERIITSAPYRYKHYTIVKRNGGTRDIHHPSPALKAIQRWIAKDLLGELPVHDSVYSYRLGRNIAMHANAHVRSNFIVRFDFANFFPSIAHSTIRSFLIDSINRNHVSFDLKTTESIVRLVCRHDKDSKLFLLSIGAPSSPHISNALLFNFDREMTQRAISHHCVYTRYADDIYLSGRSREDVQAMEGVFLELTEEMLPFLRVNQRKTQHLSRKRRMSVTGINITTERKLSVGRELKRSLKTRVFLALNGELDPTEISELRGMLSHVSSVEPTFVENLNKKFGADEVRSLINPSGSAR